MTKQIAIIDPFVRTPAINCFNNLVKTLGLQATYHIPSIFGIETLLKTRSETAAYIILGSASHVHEKLPWHLPLVEFALEELQKKRPLLGICFGHQIMCHALGAKVEYYSSDEEKQMGNREVEITQDFWNYKKGEVFNLAVTHKQVVRDLPEHLIEVGHSLSNDIVIHKGLPFLGTQAHPEASDYFCHNDITNLNESEIASVQKSGTALIKRFFEFHL